MRETGPVQVRRLGRDALLVEVTDGAAALALYCEARRREVAARDVVPAACTVLFDGVPDVDGLAGELPTWAVPPATAAGTHVEVPTTYDGQDLEDVARLWDMSTEEVVATHTATEFQVAFCGFSPGFAYCTGLPERLAVPRLDTPRAKVPAGSVGLAGPFTGIYPTASPGGWRLVGRTTLGLWDADRDPPATLPPGTRVRFVPA
jgi:KipI family sensor histidine kinase inhibitor